MASQITVDVEKEIPHHNVHVVELSATEISPPSHGDDRTFLASIRRYRWSLVWCVYLLWCVLANNYGKTAGQSVLGIPQFRKDFGEPYDGNYVLSATWQSAYYGAPQAAYVNVRLQQANDHD
jgi:hypothetical protein